MLEVEEKYQNDSAKQFGIKILFAFVYFPHTPYQQIVGSQMCIEWRSKITFHKGQIVVYAHGNIIILCYLWQYLLLEEIEPSEGKQKEGLSIFVTT